MRSSWLDITLRGLDNFGFSRGEYRDKDGDDDDDGTPTPGTIRIEERQL